MMKVKYYTCPECKKKFKTLNGWGNHMDTMHPDVRPEGYSTSRFFYFVKTGRTHGNCRTCKKPTTWNENSMKYNQYCDDPKCKEEYSKIAKKRMIGKYGKVHLLNDPDQQRKMLANRRISGKYRFQDGTKFGYVGMLEKNFLEMMDTLMNWPSNDIFSPSPHTYYYDYKNPKDKENEGQKFYIPDFYIPSLNLEIEIKQQTSTNEAYNAVNKVKERLKDEVMNSNNKISYLKINDNDFTPFFQFLMERKELEPTDTEKPVIESDLSIPQELITTESFTNVIPIDGSSEFETIRTVKDKNGVISTLITTKSENYIMRARSEVLILKDDKIFINFKRDGGYSFPGGGWDEGESPIDAAIREAKEEVRIIVKDLKPCGTQTGKYDKIEEWIKEKYKKSDWWEGYYCTSFIGQFDSTYTGYIAPEDEDDMLKTGSFRDIKEVYPFLSDFHKEAIRNYFKGGCIAQEASIPDIDTIENYFKENGYKSGIHETGKWGLKAFIEGKDDTLFLIIDKDYKKISSDLNKLISDDYVVRQDNFNTLFLKRKKSVAVESSIGIANESFFDLFKKKEFDTDSWANKIFGGKGVLGKSFTTRFVGAKITPEGRIEIKGINYHLLKSRIQRYYDDKAIFNIFLPKYNAISYKAFERKRIQRCDIKIDYMYTEVFFALELVRLFTDLGKRFRDKTYLSMAKTIYEASWLKEADNKAEETSEMSLTRLKNITLTLNDYQKDFIAKYPKLKAQLNLKGYILAFEQGLGKTLTAIGLSKCLNVDHVYIVCPNSLKENWALEIQKYYKKYAEDEDLWRSEVFICNERPIYFNKETTKFMIINNESIEKMFPYVMGGKNMLILDESHNFRNMNSKRVHQLIQLRDMLKCTDTLIMSGTPIKATPDEIVPALLMIDPTFTMEAATIFTKAFKLKSSLGTSLVQTRFGKIMYRKEKDVLDGKLPEKFIESLPLKISNGDKFIMENVNDVVMSRFSELFMAGYDDFKALEIPFLKMSKKYSTNGMEYDKFKMLILQMVKKNEYLHEIDKIFVENYMKKVKENIKIKKEKDQYDFLIKNYVRYQAHCLGVAFGEILPPYRRDMYIALYDENKDIFFKMIKENLKKTLIFTQFKGVANFVYKSLNDFDIGAVMITGDVKNRMEILKEFKENDSVRVLVATSQTIGTGVTLIEANQMFFFGPPWRDADFEQCSDRIHRIGQTDDCYIYTVTLDTGDALNLSTRMDDILNWSKQMTGSVILKTDDKEDLDQNHFEELLKAEECTLEVPNIIDPIVVKTENRGNLISEFLSEPEKDQIIQRKIIPIELLDQYFYGHEDYMHYVYTALKPIPEGVVIHEHGVFVCRIADHYGEKDFSKMAKELINGFTKESVTTPNVRFEKRSTDGRDIWDIVTERDIKPGDELVLRSIPDFDK